MRVYVSLRLSGREPEKTIGDEGEARVVGVLVSQKLGSLRMAVLTLARTFIGFIFKIRYHCNCPSLSMGLASDKLLAMVSAGSRLCVSFRVDARATGTVWKVRACGKRVADTYRHQHAPTVLQTLKKLIAATNKKPCLAGRADGAVHS